MSKKKADVTKIPHILESYYMDYHNGISSNVSLLTRRGKNKKLISYKIVCSGGAVQGAASMLTRMRLVNQHQNKKKENRSRLKMSWTKNEIIEGIRCERCYPRAFGEMVDDSAENLYLYTDLGGNTRCFCKKHMSYGKNGSGAMLKYEDDWDYPCYGAKLKSEIMEQKE